MTFFHARGSGNPEEAPSAPTTEEQATGIIPRAKSRPGMGANDGSVDDFIALAESWIGDDGKPILAAQPSSPQQLMLDAIAGQFSAGQMRQLGGSLLKLADALDDDWKPEELQSTYGWLTQAGRIERRSLQLAQVAVRMRLAANRRRRHLSTEWFGEPAWEMLLELFIQFAGGARVSTKSLVIASGAPDTTGLRVIDRLEEAGLVERSPSQLDKRVTHVSLTKQGVVAVGMVLMEAEA
jgi:hypothetical protein